MGQEHIRTYEFNHLIEKLSLFQKKRLSQHGEFGGNLPREFRPGSKGRKGQVPITGTVYAIIIYSHQPRVGDIWEDSYLGYRIGC